MAELDLTVYCMDEECADQQATYKVAAEWSGGGTVELKTFGFANGNCIDRVYAAAKKRYANIHVAEGERLGKLRIFQMDTAKHDYELTPADELEERLGKD